MLSTPPCIKGDLFGIQEHLYRRKGKIVTSFLIAWSLPSRGDQFAVALTAQGFVDEPNPFKKMSLWTLLQVRRRCDADLLFFNGYRLLCTCFLLAEVAYLGFYCQAALLVVNAAAILNEQRFLDKCEFSRF